MPPTDVQTLLTQLQETPSEGVVREVIEFVRAKHPRSAGVAAALARVLAESGAFLSRREGLIADVASTGGPGSLSTLLTPLYLRAGGAIVPKLGVPGRPAGGVDCLAQVPGFRPELCAEEVDSILDATGYAHFVATRDMAPLDGTMFELRQKANAQGVPTLVVASLLSKKLAAGITTAGLDVRVSPNGNFGGNWESARANAALFTDAAAVLGIRATPVLTDARYPYQPYLGRAESLVALQDIFDERACCWLDDHRELCKALAMHCLPAPHRAKAGTAGIGELRLHFEQNLVSQGASASAFRDVVEATRAASRFDVVAETQGFCTYALYETRDCLVSWQSNQSWASGERFPDPVGVILLHRPGVWVEEGTVLARVRAPTRLADDAARRLQPLLGRPSVGPSAVGIEAANG